MFFCILLILTYFLCGIPFGLLMTKLVAGVDVREVGSGNIGATNVNRVLGRKFAVLVLSLDAAKAFLPMFIGVYFDLSQQQLAFIGMAAVIGHCFPAALRFKGGKGVASALGVVFAMNWAVALVLLAIWVLAYLASKISAVGGLVAAGSLPIVTYIFYRSSPFFWMALAISILVIVRHRKNIKKLIMRPA